MPSSSNAVGSHGHRDMKFPTFMEEVGMFYQHPHPLSQQCKFINRDITYDPDKFLISPNGP